MTQLVLPESNSGVDISGSNPSESESEIQKTPAASSPSQPYVVVGPHARVRTLLLWVNRLLAYDEATSVSAISVSELRQALLAFQKDLWAQGLGGAPGVSSPFHSSTRTGPRSGGNRRYTIKERTSNFKS